MTGSREPNTTVMRGAATLTSPSATKTSPPSIHAFLSNVLLFDGSAALPHHGTVALVPHFLVNELVIII